MSIKLGFKYRVALMAAVLSLCTLFVVVWLIQDRVHEVKQQQALTELCLQARRMALVVRTVAPVLNIERSSIARLQVDSTGDYLMEWRDNQAKTTLKSSDWPADLDRSKFKWSVVPATREDEMMTARGQAATVECRRANFIINAEYRRGNWLAAEAITPYGYGFAAINLHSIVQSTWKTITQPVVAVVAPIALVLSLLSAWALSVYVMWPVKRLGAAMTQVSSGLQIDPLPIHDLAPEFQQLINSYNDMVQRLKKSFEQISRFSADAAHELKTPLTILRGQIEQALLNPEKSDVELLLIELQSQVSDLSAITRKLLLLSQADAGHLLIDKKSVNWSALLSSALDDTSVLVKQQQVRSDIDPGLQVLGDEVMLRQLCINLLTNALFHGLPTGQVNVKTYVVQDGIETLFTNNCEPIPQAERHLFFDRFYRRDEVRQRGVNGSGLGLSLAREIARAHGGDLVLENTAEDIVEFKLTLPAA